MAIHRSSGARRPSGVGSSAQGMLAAGLRAEPFAPARGSRAMLASRTPEVPAAGHGTASSVHATVSGSMPGSRGPGVSAAGLGAASAASVPSRRRTYGFTHPDLQKLCMADPRDTRMHHNSVPIIAFYFPGHEEPWDQLCQASFLGNFFELDERISINPAGRPLELVQFTNAEAAFQALKFWRKAFEFATLSGNDAFTLKKRLTGQEDWSYSGHGSNWDAMEHVLRSKFKKGSTCARYLELTGDAFLLEHNSVSGRDTTWSDNHIGDGQNWLGLQLMKIRDELSSRPSWTRYLKSIVDLKTGQVLSSEWPDIVKMACDAVHRVFPGAATSGPGRHPMPGGPRCGCGKPTWNGQWNETCSRSCPGPRIPDPSRAAGSFPSCGCGKPTWNGQWNETCSRSCPGPRVPDPSGWRFTGGHPATRAAAIGAVASPLPCAMAGAKCGCGKPTWNGEWNELCMRSCPGPRVVPSSGQSSTSAGLGSRPRSARRCASHSGVHPGSHPSRPAQISSMHGSSPSVVVTSRNPDRCPVLR
eukprot:TRINITY_DN4002_c0_g2_i1.p1 TRINITY_DN4002_c0_g2~~TRINITY_DN4002_c0_g2_i1.p1  ORF type:complete len:529 (-),score=41.79 TRINITY_DN4002_c0_g2_i1:119-1705(-)